MNPEIMKGEVSGQNNRPFIFVSFYTVDSGYEAEKEKLKASLHAFNLDYYLEGIKTLGSWKMNIHYRPAFLEKCLERFYPRPIVCVDSDAIVRSYPTLFEFLCLKQDDYDIAVHYFRGRELLAGTIFWSNRIKSKDLLHLWAEYDKKMIHYKEQKNLQDVLQAHPEFIVYRLPAAYTQIFDLMRNEGAPVIEHFQASRRFRKAMGITPKEQEIINRLNSMQRPRQGRR
jgi:hypothetical protein